MENVQALGELSLAELFERFPRTIPVFFKQRMACIGCDLNMFHSVAEAIALYGIEPSGFLAELDQACAPLDVLQQPPDGRCEENR